LDPFVQNMHNYMLISMFLSDDYISKNVFRAVFIFVLLYIAGSIAAMIIGSVSFINCLNPDEMRRERKIAILVIMMVHALNL